MEVEAEPLRPLARPKPAGPVVVQLALRLEIENRQITEAEHVFARIEAPAQIAALQTPRPALLATVPSAQRTPRSSMLLIANAKNGWSPFIK